jgi:PIN domain nuclease of toxin-antitoxin system
MRLLLDTHILVWIMVEPHRITPAVRRVLIESDGEIAFSVAVLWELTVKNGTARAMKIEPEFMRDKLLAASFEEVPITAAHALAVSRLPRLHGDPFDRIMMAQALVESRTLVTADRAIQRYPGVPLMAL